MSQAWFREGVLWPDSRWERRLNGVLKVDCEGVGQEMGKRMLGRGCQAGQGRWECLEMQFSVGKGGSSPRWDPEGLVPPLHAEHLHIYAHVEVSHKPWC